MRHVIEAISLERLDQEYPEGNAERGRVTTRLARWTDQHHMTPTAYLARWNRTIQQEAAEREAVMRAALAQVDPMEAA